MTIMNARFDEHSLTQLLIIALFDFWIANEDRTANNYNLLYRTDNRSLVSIDYGGILNSCTMNRPLSQLEVTDSILYSDLFDFLSQDTPALKISLQLEKLFLSNV